MKRILQNISHFFLSAIIIISLHSCERDNAKDALNEVEIINSLFDSLFQINRAFSFRIHKDYMDKLWRDPSLKWTSDGIDVGNESIKFPIFDQEKYKRGEKEFQKLIDTVTWIAVTSDTLEKLDVKGDRGTYIFEGLEPSDSLFRKFINKASEHIYEARYISIKPLAHDRLKFLNINQLPEKERLDEWIEVTNDTCLVGGFSMTRIAFNDTRDLGIFFFGYSFVPYRHDYGDYILINRINNKWVISKKIKKGY